MALAPGTRLGRYVLSAPIGAGGMGEVYSATDSDLKRQVAIKVLPDAVAKDAERLARFQREAEVLASLSHPNIAIIHGLEKTDGVTAIVMELVAGPTLADRIAKGPLPVDEALAIAAQIAEALESAHEQGVIHRDLKPANIKVRPDGTVKVLDFGLAKALDQSGAASHAQSESPTITTPAMTHAGVILGTTAYMSPEQARGAAVDRRTDIWAFGCVLYEMLTGRMAFGARTATETLARVLEGHADLDALPPATPLAIRRLIRRCLERPVRDRVQHIGDARADIADLRAGKPDLADPATVVATAARRRPAFWAGATIGVAALAAAAAWFGSRSIAPQQTGSVPIRFDVARVEAPPLGPASRSIALSPDGSRVAYATRSSLRVRAVGGDDVALPAAGREPFFSPDGEWVAFFTENGLHRMPVGGGAARLITAERSGRERTFGGSWGPGGTVVFSAGGGLLRVGDEGGATEVVADPDTAAGEVRYAWPMFLPDGRSVLFTILGAGGAADARIAVIDLMTRQRKAILQGGHAARYLQTGHLLYASGGRLQLVGFDAQRLETVGVPTPVDGAQIGTAGGFNADFDVSATGTFAYVPPTGPPLRTMMWVDRDGREEPIPAEPRQYIYPRFSPDGTRVALDIGGENRDIWVWHFARRVLTRITTGPTEDLMPAWSPDGTRVFYGSDRGGRVFRLFSVAADRAGSERQEFAGRDSFMPLAMPAADTLLAFTSGVTAPSGDIAAVTLGEQPEARTLLGGDGVQASADVSPDGRWVAYNSAESGQSEVYVRPYPSVDRRREPISSGGGIQPLWGPAGSDELFYWTLKGELKAVRVTLTPDLRIGASRSVPLGDGYVPPSANSSWTYGVSPTDGRLLLFKPVPDSGGLAPIKVVVNWFDELDRRRAADTSPSARD